MIDLSDVIGSKETGDILGISTQHVKRLVVSGDLSAHKISAGYLFLKSDVMALKKERAKKL